MKILIVGGGIAGTSLAHNLNDRGIDFRVVENTRNQSSLMAAGILNPLVFRRMNLSWRAAEFMPFSGDFYQRMEKLLELQFFIRKPIRRFFASEQEAGYWLQKQEENVYSDYMKIQDERDKNYDSPQNTFGTGLVLNSAMVDTAAYIPAQWQWLKDQGKLIEETFDYSAFNPETAAYKGESYDFVVFAQGKDARNNPWFGNLPLQATKGELLTISLPALSQEESLNRKCFLFPLGDSKFRIGSTYGWDQDNVETTEAGKLAILENLKSLTDEIPEIIDQQAGVRPTTPDRRPFLGKHAEFPKLAVANGLGTKGYMTAPLLMKELADHLIDGAELHHEVSIIRFDKNVTNIFTQ